ncbi:MAG TPA: kelch repeat-containing protein, partial [Planctomycetaceae bacterium]|nr:kelch repeat-containing protein [Planctomycetaceae bacterium]
MHRIVQTALLLVILSSTAFAQLPELNTWHKLPEATLEGRRFEWPLGYATSVKRFMILGGRTPTPEYKKPRSFDQLLLDVHAGRWDAARWENWFPEGKNWGPQFGTCTPPGWKGERWQFTDEEGNTRPNWCIYGTFSLGHAYAWDPDTQTFLFYANGSTFRYDLKARTWTDLKPENDPQQALGGILLWSSLCYAPDRREFLLFGGGNVQTERGDPGTWIYAPADNRWTRLDLDRQPPQRANSQLAYDPVAKKAVLFGGDQLDQLLDDTWIFDFAKREWEQVSTPVSPAPRAGHALLWLPKAQKIALIGGYDYTSATGYVESMYRRQPVEIWIFDATTRRWNFLRRFDPKAAPEGPVNGMLHAAADENDTVVTTGNNSTWMCRIDASQIDAQGGTKFGGNGTDVERRTGPYDPAWFSVNVPPVDREWVKSELASLPANEWVLRPTPKLPRPNMDWGSAVFLPEHDQIVRFSGGHSAYSGTAPVVYDVQTDRYSLPFAPEFPIEFVYSNDQVHGEWSFKGNPWMTGHTYKATGHDPHSKSLVFAAHDYTHFFDPKPGRWSRNRARAPFIPNMYVVTLATTSQGVVAWADKRTGGNAGLWRLTGEPAVWEPLQLQGELPQKSPDRHGMAYDSKRDRLLMFSNV